MDAEIKIIDDQKYPALAALLETQLSVTPGQRRFLARRFKNASADELQTCESLTDQIRKIKAGSMDAVHDNYEFICDIVLEEEIYFREHGNYRLSTFEEANTKIYSNADYMSKYVDGILISQIFWKNHTESYMFCVNHFLAGAKDQYDYLEIGPGHGLMLSQAARDPRASSVTGWDVSETSIAHTKSALANLGIDRDIKLVLQDLMMADSHSASFDAVVFSEVMEHLEDPKSAIERIAVLLRPGGRLYVNVPVNSPAPDHIYLFRTPEAVCDMLREVGLEIEEAGFFPGTGYDLERARALSATISACIIARRPAA